MSPRSYARSTSATPVARARSRIAGDGSSATMRTDAPAAANAAAFRTATGAAADDEHRQRGSLDEDRDAAHRKRPPPFVSATRNATYSAITAANETLE